MNSFVNLLTGEIYNCTYHWEACDYFYKEALSINRLDLYSHTKIKRLKQASFICPVGVLWVQTGLVLSPSGVSCRVVDIRNARKNFL